MWRLFGRLENVRFRQAGRLMLVGAYCAPLCFMLISELVFRNKARAGDAKAMYDLGRLIECRSEYLAIWYPYPSPPDMSSGLVYLQRSAEAEYPPALYAFGVRLKDDFYISNAGYSKSDGPMFIDKAIAKGFVTVTPEAEYFIKVYRRWP